MTPRQLQRHFDAANKASVEDYNTAIQVAYVGAFLTHVDPKKYPKLETYLISDKPGSAQSPDQMLRIVKAMNAAMNGKVLGKEDD